ncbi:MAG: hypothetical protein HFF46_05810 [Lawsonibacter sp.]|nr:hypothetical protein [Lawsonibacter sp.]
MFVFYAEKNRLYVMEKELITSGSANIYPVRFEFSPDWDGLERTAIFQAGCRKKSVPIVDGVCSVPAEVLSDPGRYLMMGVCGKQGESVVLPTVWANLGWIVEGAVPGGNPLPEDWQEALDGKGDTLAYTEEGELGLYSGDKLLSSVPIEGGGGEGVPGPQGEPGADATINGVNTLELAAGENIVLDQQGNRLTISSTGGVTHAELEEAMSGKQDVITSGDGLEKEGSTLRVSSPVQGVISQEAYDALPEEKRNKGLYVIPGESSLGVPDPDVYSFTERVVGVWVDGSPLYQRVIQTTLQTSWSGKTAKLVDIPDLDMITQLRYKVKNVTSLNMDMFFDGGLTLGQIINTDSIGVYMSKTSYSFGKSIELTVKYTKTTDQSKEVSV